MTLITQPIDQATSKKNVNQPMPDLNDFMTTPEAIGIIIAAWRAQFDQLQESGNVREIKA